MVYRLVRWRMVGDVPREVSDSVRVHRPIPKDAATASHDQCRSISRWTSDSPEFRHAAGKMLALMEMSSFGTTYVYQGQPNFRS